MNRVPLQKKPYNDLNSWLRERFGTRVQKLTIDAGFTCPNRDGTVSTGGCIYCNEKGSGTGAHARGASVTEQIISAKKAMYKRYRAEKFMAYFQAFTNTFAPVEKLKALYEEAIAAPGIVGLTIGTRPDCVPDEVLDMLAELNERVWVTVEYGVQTVHDRTLEIINRGHTYSQFLDALERTRSRGLDAGVHMILGLPGETEGDMLESARSISLLDIQAVKIHLLYVIRGTVLEKMYNNGDYHCLTREQYISVLCDFISLLPPHMVIHRLTGDPHPHELAAPEWALGKDENLDIIRKTMSERGVFQGSGFPPGTRKNIL